MKLGHFSWMFSCCFLALIYTFIPHRSLAEEADADIPTAARVVLAKAGKLINNKEYPEAIALLVDFQAQALSGKIGEADDKGRLHAEVHHALGTCYLLDNNFLQAARALDLAVKKDPKHLSARLNLAKAAYELRDYPKAAECFAKAYDLGPEKNPEFLYFSAVAHLLAGQHGKSIADFEKLLTTHRDNFLPEWRENLVHALLAAGENRRALPHIRELTEVYRDARQMQWQEILLHQYLHLDMQREALTLVDRLTARTPTEPKWWRALAHIHLLQNRYQPALTALLVTGYLEPLAEEESRLVADLYLQLGVPVKAVAIYKDILADTKNPRLLTNLVVALQQTGQTEQALAVLNRFTPEALSPELAMLKVGLQNGMGLGGNERPKRSTTF